MTCYKISISNELLVKNKLWISPFLLEYFLEENMLTLLWIVCAGKFPFTYVQQKVWHVLPNAYLLV